MSENTMTAPYPPNPEKSPTQVTHILQGLSALSSDNLDRSTLFSFLSARLREAFHYDRLSIYLYDAEREFLNAFTAADGAMIEMFSNTRIAHNTVAWQAIQTRKTVVISDLTTINSKGGASQLAQAGLRATIAVPLILNREVIGTLHVSFEKQPDNFAEIQNLLISLAPVLALCLFTVLTEERHARTLAERQAVLEEVRLADLDGNSKRLAPGLLETRDMAGVMSVAKKVAKLAIPVLITGETGTGKSMLARWLHRNSPRATANLVNVNCPSLAPTLFESEMFGYAKGAFTGASAMRIGRIELAQGGTLFLDEIGELQPEMQSKLLQVLEENCFERVGEARSIGVDIRIISATNVNVEQALESGALRRDLFYRLATVTLHMPPLRQRRNDIPILVDHFVREISRQWTLRPPFLSKSVMRALCAHDWPGNLRELRNVTCQLLIHALEHSITEDFVEEALHERNPGGAPATAGEVTPKNAGGPDATATSTQSPESAAALPKPHRHFPSLEENERLHILEALRLSAGRVAGPKGAAALLGVPRSTLQNRMRKLGITAQP